jgi:hypothetical protein
MSDTRSGTPSHHAPPPAVAVKTSCVTTLTTTAASGARALSTAIDTAYAG